MCNFTRKIFRATFYNPLFYWLLYLSKAMQFFVKRPCIVNKYLTLRESRTANFILFLTFAKTKAHHKIMDQDQEFLRAIIERRQQMLAKMGDQIKKEHQGIDQKLDDLISALNDEMLLQEDIPRKSVNFPSDN